MTQTEQNNVCFECTAHPNACETKSCPLMMLGGGANNTGRMAEGVRSNLGSNKSNGGARMCADSPVLSKMRSITNGGMKR